MQLRTITLWVRISLAIATMSLGSTIAAGSEITGAPIVACVVKTAAELGFNGNIHILVGHEVIERSFGSTDAVGKVPTKSQTRFNIASAGKMFTAVDIGRLIDQGALQFEAPIGRYLGGLQPDIAAITVAELLNHTSGLGNYFDPRNTATIENAHTATDLLSVALAEPLAFSPGSKRAYSNSGFVVLGAIIEKLSGKSYADFTQTEILDPLNMRHTTFDARDGAIPMSLMSPKGALKTPEVVPAVFQHSSPAGGIYSTVEDMVRFLTALNDGRLLTHKTWSELLLPRSDPAGGGTVYGYGFNVRAEAPRRIGHGGGAPGINAEIALYPDSGSQIIALSNRDPPTATHMVTVLETVIFAAEPKRACAEALADPALRAPTARRPPG